jgi:hypothetical protein
MTPTTQLDPIVSTLIDALVEAIDTDRDDAVHRVQAALEPFGAASLFTAELRLNGRSSEGLWQLLADGDLEELI